MSQVNHQVRLAARPNGLPRDTDWSLTSEEVPSPGPSTPISRPGRRALREHAPRGVGVYFDNVGGEILDAVLTVLARGARVVISGAISQYNETQVRGPANYMMLLVTRSSMTGFLVFDFADRYAAAMAELAGWLREGKLVSREHVVRGGVADFPATLLSLFDGANTGKLVLALDGGGVAGQAG